MSEDAKTVYTNLRVLKKSRKKPVEGDVFAFQLPDDQFSFGRVMGANMSREEAPFPGSNLVYIYAALSRTPIPEFGQLTPERLLIPPTFTNRKSWTLGYFMTVLNAPLVAADVLQDECFEFVNGRYFNRRREDLPVRTKMCGQWALTSYRKLDDLISGALGFMPAPASPGDKEYLG